MIGIATVEVSMKNPALSLWLSAANRAAGWWIGTATAILRQQQAAVAEMTRAAAGKKPARKRKARARRWS